MKALKTVAAALATIALTACTVQKAETPPPLSGPSGLSLSVTVSAIPDSIGFDGGSQSSIRISAIGPNGRPVASLPLRVDMMVNGVPQDFGTLSARTVVTNADGIATVIYTAPPTPPGSNFGTCNGLAGTCVEIVATPTGSSFAAAIPQSVLLRLVPPGVIVAPGSTPTARFTVAPAAPVLNEAVTFDASTSLPGTGATRIVSFSWTFGDGATGTGQVVSHTFTSAGVSNSVTLTITNDLGASSSTTQVVAVGSASAALPVPVFTSSPTGPVVGQTVFFNAGQSTAGPGHTIVSYRWAFGDGATASGVTTTHPYAVAGSYNVQLTVIDEAGQSVTSAPTAISVGLGNPTAVLTVVKTGGTSVQADGSASTATGTAQIVTYTFIWGDGSPAEVSTTPVRSHAYAPPVAPALTSTFTVTLRVTDNATPPRTGTASQTITVP